MKSCIREIRALLLADATLVALIGQRVALFQAIQDAPLPDIVLQDISASFTPSMGSTGGPYGRRVSVMCRATTYDVAQTVGERALAVLESFKGAQGGLLIQGIIPVSDAGMMDDTNNVFHRILDFRVHYS